MEDDDFERLRGYYFEELEIGMCAEVAKTFSEADVLAFARVSGDDNPLHLDEEFASRTRAGGRVVHGMVTASLISTLVGVRLPGPGCLWMGQTLKFLRPVKVGEEVRATAQVTGLVKSKQRATMRTECRVGDALVIEGEAVVWVPSADRGAG